MNIDYVKQNIKSMEELLVKVDTMHLGKVLSSLQQYKVFDFKYGQNTLDVEMFSFQCYDHDTGIHTTCEIVDGEDRLQIINKPYFKGGSYCSKVDFWLTGAWDKKLEEVIQYLREQLKTHLYKRIKDLEHQIEKEKQEQTDKITKFSKLFD